jgi:hypothetical protein
MHVLRGPLCLLLIWLAMAAGSRSVGPLTTQRPGNLTEPAVRVAFVARVHNVYDPGNSLQDMISVGDHLRGTVTYDPHASDASPSPTVGRYEHRRAPYGFVVEAGPFIFQTDPTTVDFAVEVSNDHGVPPRDGYLATSANNSRLQNGAVVARIFWQLVDDSLEALDSTRLPSTAPDLEKWSSEFGLTLEGHDTVEFIVRAHVIEAMLCTGPMRCPSPQ